MDPGGQARVFFVMGRRDPPDRDDNINARYIVEEARITGVPDDELTQPLRDDLQALVGKRLDSGDADRFQERLESELPRYDISRRIRRGSEVGRIRLVYEARKKELPAWLSFVPLRGERALSFRTGLGKLPGPRHRRRERSASRQSSPSTTRTTSSRSTPAADCASRRESWERGGSARASSGPGSIRTGVRATLATLALETRYPGGRTTHGRPSRPC